MLILMIALLFIGTMIILANMEQVRGESNPLLKLMQYGLVLLIALWVMNAIALLAVSPEQVADTDFVSQVEHIDKTALGIFIALGSLAILVLIGLIHSQSPHQWIEHYLTDRSEDSLYAYDSSLSVHKLAIMLAIVQVVSVVWTFILSGGLSGLDLSESTPLEALSSLGTGALLYTSLGLLGVGWLSRRNLRDVLARLSLRFPTWKDWIFGIAMAIVLYGISRLLTVIWIANVSLDVLEQQTAVSQQLFNSFSNSLILGLLLALLSGISEEILFRGALQPVFGIIPTSIFFTIIHIQYTLTPATIIIFIVSLGFGWLRLRYNTTSAIIAHIVYNFIPFLLYTLATNSGAFQ